MFSNYIRNVSIEDGKILVSFNVTSLYMKTPIIDVLNTIKDYINNNYQFTRNMPIPQDKLLDLVNVVLTTIWYTFHSGF